MNDTDRYTCPFDSEEDTVERSEGDLAKHMGLKKDKLHKDWRKSHNLPENMDMGTVNKNQFEIFIAIGKDRNLFHPKKK